MNLGPWPGHQREDPEAREFKWDLFPHVRKRGRLLKNYWTVRGRQIETSVVLADSKESTSFSARPIRFTSRNRLHCVRTENDAFWRRIS
jgi:hypothetical protein